MRLIRAKPGLHQRPRGHILLPQMTDGDEQMSGKPAPQRLRFRDPVRREDSRKNERINLSGRVSGKMTKCEDNPERRGEVFEGTIVDVSAMGIGIMTETDLPDGTLVTMRVEMGEGRGSKRYRLKGEVRWRTPPGTQGARRVGILLTGRPRWHFFLWQNMAFAAVREKIGNQS